MDGQAIWRHASGQLLVSLIVISLATQQSIHASSSEATESTTGRGNESGEQQQQESQPPVKMSQAQIEQRTFAVGLLKALHEQYGENRLQERQSAGVSGRALVPQLLEALGAEGDMQRLIDWVRNSFNLASIPELTTQFVVSKLGAVNCAALLQPDREETLVPRFLLFNEHYMDVPYELPVNPTSSECLVSGKFDPTRKTIVMIHGYLGGYTLIDGLTNIKNRLLDLNRFATEKAIESFIRASQTNDSYVFTEDLNLKIRSQLYNVIIVDWFNGANPRPRANYIKAAVNSQVVGKLIARFLSSLIVHCGTSGEQLQIIAHSLGCHVSGFTGKAMKAAGHRLGKIIHLDPVGLCFGRLFSQPRLRLSPSDALDTQAVHVSLNIFDNPLDGAHSNILVNGGRDQPGCGNQNELTNSTTSSVSLLFDPAARFAPCSHLRALALFEDDHSSEPGECQLVAYRCASYERFLAGKCAYCDATNGQCRLTGLPPLSMRFRKLVMAPSSLHQYHTQLASDENENARQLAPTAYTYSNQMYTSGSSHINFTATPANKSTIITSASTMPLSLTNEPLEAEVKRAPKSWLLTSPAPPFRSTRMFGQPAYYAGDNNELSRRADRRLISEGKRERITQALERLRNDTRLALTSLREHAHQPIAADHDDDDDNADHDDDGLPAGDNNLLAESDSLNAATSSASATSAEPHAAQATPLTQTTTASTTVARPTTTLPSDILAQFESKSQTATVQRLQDELLPDQIPLGGQAIPAGSLNGPLYFVGTSSMSPYCVNYYQFRVLIAESRLMRMMSQNGLASNRLKAQYNQAAGGVLRAAAAASLPLNQATGGAHDMLHLTVKLTDTRGHFFKGFSLLENARQLARVPNDFLAPAPLPQKQASIGLNEPMAELTMLLNSTRAQPIKVSETIISYYFHPIVLADRVEVNYMSNISPEVRAKYSSVLCPVAINDRHQLVKYVECHKVGARRK